MKYISKSSYMAGLDCHRKLWQKLWDRDSAAPLDGMTELIFEFGNRFGVLAHSLYPDATLIDVLASAAALRAAQIGGALRWSLEAALTYAGERQAFGRPIAKFQAVQHHLARLAGEVCATEVGAAVALQALDDGPARMEAAAAKIRADEAASDGALIAHQVFGAIGLLSAALGIRFFRWE